MKRFQFIVLFAYFLYFLTFLVRFPGLPSQPANPIEPGRIIHQTDESGSAIETPPLRQTAAAPEGALLERVAILNRSLALLDDPLLESDARPDLFFRRLERSFTVDVFLMSLTMLWCAVLLLCLLALLKRHWFSVSMLRMVLLPSILLILLLLFTVRSESLLGFQGANPFFMFKIFGESVLVFMGIAVVMRGFLPEQDTARAATQFLTHLQKTHRSPVLFLQNALGGFSQMTVVLLVALCLANFVLLPIFSLQQNFPKFFALLFLCCLFLLFGFYTWSYMRVARAQKTTGATLSAVAFLGFRGLNNLFFMLALTALIFVVAVVLALLALMNIDALESLQLIQKSSSL